MTTSATANPRWVADGAARQQLRVLHINKFGWAKGGSDVYALGALERLAADPRFAVAFWAAAPEVSEAVGAYAAQIPDFHEVSGGVAKLRSAANVLWSRQAQRDLAAVVDDFQPDVAHLHLYSHQFSSSIIHMLRARGIPVVSTAHDYKLICPAYSGVRSGADCFQCAKRLSPALITSACLHDDRAWSAVAFAEAWLVRRLRSIPDVVIAPSRFIFERLHESWLPPHTEIELNRYPAQPSGTRWEGGGDYLLYVGRLSPEKGADAAVIAAKRLSIPLVLAGDGPSRPMLEELARSDENITFLGHVAAARLETLRQRCLAQVVPSACPEVLGLAAVEAALDGVPLIAANRGGLPEIFEQGARGVVLSEESPEAWESALRQLKDIGPPDERHLERLRNAYDWNLHLATLAATYERAFARRQARLSPETNGLRSTTAVVEQ